MRCLIFLLLAFLFAGNAEAQGPSSEDLGAIAFAESMHEKLRVKNWSAFLNYHLERKGIQEELALPSFVSKAAGGEESVISPEGSAESEVHAAVNPRDTMNIVVSCMKQDPENIAAPLSFPTYYTTDFGATWQSSSFAGVVAGGGIIAGGGDPVIVFDDEGIAHIVWLLLQLDLGTLATTARIFYAISEDGGANFTVQNEAIVSGDLTVDPNTGAVIPGERVVDKPWLAVDRSGGDNNGNLYMPFFDVLDMGMESKITLKRKLATASSWDESEVWVNTNTYAFIQFASVDVDAMGRVHVSFFASNDGQSYALYHALSEDAGLSFSEEQKISDVAFPAIDPATGTFNYNLEGVTRLYPCPHIKVDKSGGIYDGFVYAVWTGFGVDSQETAAFDIYFARSEDGGATWNDAVILNDDSDVAIDQFFPSLDVNDEGRLVIGWYDRRADANNVLTEYFLTYSDDGGESFEAQCAVSSAPSDFSSIGLLNGDFGIGEYTQVVSTNNYMIPVWADGRGNDGEVRIYAGFIQSDLDEPLGLEMINGADDQALTCIPNPVKDVMQVDLALQKTGPCHLSLVNSAGRIVHVFTADVVWEAGKHQFSYDSTGLMTGTYFLVLDQDGQIRSKKIIIGR